MEALCQHVASVCGGIVMHNGGIIFVQQHCDITVVMASLCGDGSIVTAALARHWYYGNDGVAAL